MLIPHQQDKYVAPLSLKATHAWLFHICWIGRYYY